MALPQRFKFSDLLPILATSITLIGFIATVIAYKSQQPPPLVEVRVKEIETINAEISAVKTDVAIVKDQLKGISSVPEQSQVAAQLKGIETSIKDLTTKQSRLEDAILSNPAKAIEVPLLRKDLDNLKDSQQQNLIALKQGVDQVYDLNKWLLGAMAISIITLAVSNFLKGKEKKEPAG